MTKSYKLEGEKIGSFIAQLRASEKDAELFKAKMEAEVDAFFEGQKMIQDKIWNDIKAEAGIPLEENGWDLHGEWWDEFGVAFISKKDECDCIICQTRRAIGSEEEIKH